MLDIYHFGRGVGECSLIKLPDETWAIIDSFIDGGVPVAKSFLEAQGVPLSRVSLICLTHWHDDHVRGAAVLTELCDQAAVALSMVMVKDEFKAFLDSRVIGRDSSFTSGVNELFDILRILSDRGHRPKFCGSNRVLLRGDEFAIECLTPSDADVGEFLAQMPQWCRSFDADGRIPIPNRNDTSVAVVVESGDARALFGADLEVRNRDSGWQAVCEQSWQKRGFANFFKIPHHGSPNAHYDPCWSDLLEPNILAVLSPYGRGKTKRPSTQDIDRIKQHTNLSYSSCLLGWNKPKQLHRTVEKTLSEAGIQIWEEPKNSGVVHCSYTQASNCWVTKTQSPAGAL